jgi:hypothetical protein
MCGRTYKETECARCWLYQNMTSTISNSGTRWEWRCVVISNMCCTEQYGALLCVAISNMCCTEQYCAWLLATNYNTTGKINQLIWTRSSHWWTPNDIVLYISLHPFVIVLPYYDGFQMSLMCSLCLCHCISTSFFLPSLRGFIALFSFHFNARNNTLISVIYKYELSTGLWLKHNKSPLRYYAPNLPFPSSLSKHKPPYSKTKTSQVHTPAFMDNFKV